MKAQVSSEYIVILAVVLVLALIAVVLLRGMLGTSGGAGEQQSRAYWTVAAPLSILAQKYSGTVLQLEMQNSLPEAVQVVRIGLGGSDYGVAQTFSAGERRIVNLTLTASCGSIGDSYRLNDVQIRYQVSGMQRVQRGELPLAGTCS